MSDNRSQFSPLPRFIGGVEYKNNSIVDKLMDLYASSVDMDVILSVVESCNYDYDKCNEALRAITTGVTPFVSSESRFQDHSSRPTRVEHSRVQHVSRKQYPLVNGRSDTGNSSNTPRSSSVVVPFLETEVPRFPARPGNPSNPTLERIHRFMREGNKILVLLRGCSGSGKSHLANQLLQVCGGQRCNHVFSSDDYFVKGNGKYVFNPEELPHAHRRNQDNVLQAARNNYSPIIVDNTNTCAWEMQVYVTMAVSHGYAVETLEPQTSWQFNHAELARRNVHNVPSDRIRLQLARYENGITGADVIKQLRLNYSPWMRPPQPARNPSTRGAQLSAQPAKPKGRGRSSLLPRHAGTQLTLDSRKAFLPATEPTARFNVRDQPNPASVPLTGLSNLCVPSNSSALQGNQQNPLRTSAAGDSQLDRAEHYLPNLQLESMSQSSPKYRNCIPQSFEPNVNRSSGKPPISNFDFVGSAKQTTGYNNEAGKLQSILNQREEFSNSQQASVSNSASEEILVNAAVGPAALIVSLNGNPDSVYDEGERRTPSDDPPAGEINTGSNQEENGIEDSNAVGSWDVEDKPVQTWEMEPVIETEDKSNSDLPQRVHFSRQDGASNTNYQDFLLISSLEARLRNPEANSEIQPPPGIRVLKATSRDINEYLVNYNPPIPKKIVVDVSSMTDDGCVPVEGSVSELLRMFPHVSVANLEVILDECQGDVNWASNCLLDTGSSVRLNIACIKDSETPSRAMPSPSSSRDSSNSLSLPTSPSLEEAPVSVPNISPENQCEVCKTCANDDKLTFSPERCSSCPPVCPQSSDGNEVPIPNRYRSLPSVVSSPLQNEVNMEADSPSPTGSPGSYNLSPSREPSGESSETSSQDGDEMLEFVISSELSQQLFCRFGGPQNKLRKSGLSPLLRIPERIARQIHYYLVLSQEEYCEDEDEQYFAEEQEEEEAMSQTAECKIDQRLYEEMRAQQPLSEQEQRDMELATQIYEMDLASTYNSKDTMATMLTRRLLQEKFPTLDSCLLDELMEAQGNSFHKTKQMIEEDNMNRYNFHEVNFPKLPNTSSPTAGSCRNRSAISVKAHLKSCAGTELGISRMYQQKAKEQNAKRQWSTAAAYSQLAMAQKRDDSKNMELRTEKVLAGNLQPRLASTLDLHSFHLGQAMKALDIFLDEHVISLADKPRTSKWIYVITGRGLHSLDGVPRILPASMNRLDERSIAYKLDKEKNPGMLEVLVTGSTNLSDDC